MELECAVQTYDWGKFGENSFVAILNKASNSKFIIDPNKTYAELWMGTHPSGPSQIKESSKSLINWICENPESLGKSIIDKFGQQLPFLFKVLSINKSLSIQAHPNKQHAEQLHSERPDIYKDPNHKPELAIALTPFEAMCGFRPIDEIKRNLLTIPEFKEVIGTECSDKLLNCSNDNYKSQLAACFHSLYLCSNEKIQEQLNKLLSRIKSLDQEKKSLIQGSLLERLAEEFPGDVGCFSLYFFNVLTLQPGESVYLGPNEPHAYLSGDCIECMACSDNVVRAGLTPKYKDVETLCGMLNYDCEVSDKKIFHPVKEDQFTFLFNPPVPDFAVAQVKVPACKGEYELIVRSSASILIVITGESEFKEYKLHQGTILFISANEHIKLKIKSDTVLYQAFCCL